jgi:hypothetical protein
MAIVGKTELFIYTALATAQTSEEQYKEALNVSLLPRQVVSKQIDYVLLADLKVFIPLLLYF